MRQQLGRGFLGDFPSPFRGDPRGAVERSESTAALRDFSEETPTLTHSGGEPRRLPVVSRFLILCFGIRGFLAALDDCGADQEPEWLPAPVHAAIAAQRTIARRPDPSVNLTINVGAES